LRQTLAESGFTPYDWGLGIDDGPAGSGLKRLLHKLEEQVIEAFEAERQRLGQRPPVPFTAVYSLSDGVVPWRFCVDTESPTSENIAIAQATHLELAHHPVSLEVITHRLAQPHGDWRAFDA
jgi:hypothetical protein